MAGIGVDAEHFDGRYLDFPEFERFRNQHFARENLTEDHHVQGGLIYPSAARPQ